jgi:hypothetical protein
MVDNVLFYDLLLGILLWLGVIRYAQWARQRSPQPAWLHPSPPRRSSRALELPSHFLASLTNLPVLPVSKPQSLALQPRVSRPRGFPAPRDGRARLIPRPSSVPRRAVPIMAGWDWGIFGPMVIPAVAAGASSSV